MTTPGNVFEQKIFGVPVIQRWNDVWSWENVLDQLPQVRCIVEIGALYGGLSLFLALHALQRGQVFRSIDTAYGANNAVLTPLGMAIGLPACTMTGDVWDEWGGGKMLRDLFENPGLHPLLLLCDGGNKPRELQTFVPMLTSGDYVAVHDWGNEVTMPDLDTIIHRLDPFFLEECEQAETLTRFWAVK